MMATAGTKFPADIALVPQGISASALLQQAWQFLLVSATALPGSVSDQAPPKGTKGKCFSLSLLIGGIQTSCVSILQSSVKQHFQFLLRALFLPRSQTPTQGTCK